MHFFYFDESGTTRVKELRQDPWFFLGAVGFHSRSWHEIDDAITDLKRRYFPELNPWDVEIRSTLIRAYGTDRAKWPWTWLNRQQIESFVEEFYGFYDAFNITLFFCGIDQLAHRQRHSGAGWAALRTRHPYEYAFTIILERIDHFLAAQNEGRIGLLFLDEFKGAQRLVQSRYVWYRQRGTWVKREIRNVVEPPSFLNSKYSQMISLADIAVYNPYHAYRYRKPDYPFLERIVPRIYRHKGQIWGAGLKILPQQKMPGE